jgi:hypothetical protein
MSIIAISRCSYPHGKEIAESVATELYYVCIPPKISPGCITILTGAALQTSFRGFQQGDLQPRT